MSFNLVNFHRMTDLGKTWLSQKSDLLFFERHIWSFYAMHWAESGAPPTSFADELPRVIV